jgi:MFS family permease
MSPDEASTEKTSTYASLLIRDYRLFIFARISVTLATQIQGTVVGWQIYDLTKNPLNLGLIGLAEAIPSIVVALYAGHVADIIERKKIILSTVAVLLFCSLSLLFFTVDPGKFILAHGIYPIYGVIFLSGIARGFMTPAIFAFMPQLVPRNLFKNAISLNSTFWEASSILGPVMAGFMYKLLGVSFSYAIDASLVLMSLFFYSMIPRKEIPPATGEVQSMGEKITAGLKFVFSHQIILGAISLDLFAVLFGGAIALLPIFATKILNADAVGFGLLRAAPGIGAVIMALFITYYPIRDHVGKILLGCVAGFGLCMIGFGLSTNFWLSIALLVTSGMFDSVSVIIRATLIQTLTPENMKGRVSAVNNIFLSSSNEIGAFESGITAKWLGAVRSVVVGGALTMMVVAVTGWRAVKLRGLRKI